jgi:hypothetical protein
MNNDNHRKHLTNPAWVAVVLCTLAALGLRVAQAQATIVTAPGQLIKPVQTAPYPNSSGNGSIIPSSFTVAAGSNNLTFTATNGTPNGGFESYIADLTVGPQFTVGDVLEETFNGSSGPLATAPLQIDFQKGVTGFGLFAQNANTDTEAFTLNIFNGNTSLGSFTFGPVNNSAPSGTAVFIGAQSNKGLPITRATLSSSSTPGTGINSNDFYVGPASVQAPLPCAERGQSYSADRPCCGGLAPGTGASRGRCVGRGNR